MIVSTRLRFISSKSAKELALAVSKLRFKVEIKGGPIKDGKRWYIFFVIPEIEGFNWDSVDL